MTIYPTFKTNAKEDYRKDYEIFNETITAENVKRMGEFIALSALKYSAMHSSYYSYLYRCLLKDVFNPNEKEHIISDGYDYAQEAILFLCPLIGKKPSDTYKTDKSGKIVSIRIACMRYVNKLIARDAKHTVTESSIEELKVEPIYKAKSNADKQQIGAERTIRKMKLTKAEKAVLNCYMAGMTFVQIAKFLCVDNSTVWHRRHRLQIKYIANAK